MIIKIGISQLENSTDQTTNIKTIERHLNAYESHDVDVVVFPECALSGFSAKFERRTEQQLLSSISFAKNWSERNEALIILPSAYVGNDGQIINGGWLVNGPLTEPFYKVGLTESEKRFFASVASPGKRSFKIRGVDCALVICREIDDPSNTYVNSPDLVIWPGYYNWLTTPWQQPEGAARLNTASNWGVPLIQCNWAKNVGTNSAAAPSGGSVVAIGDELVDQDLYHVESASIIEIDLAPDQPAFVRHRILPKDLAVNPNTIKVPTKTT